MEASSSDILCREISKESQTEAEAILEQAARDAAQREKEAQAEAGRIEADIMSRASAQADALKKRILSGLHLEIKNQKIRAREAFLLKLFERVRQRLEAFRSSREYPEFIRKSVLEGVLALGMDAVEIVSGEKEKAILGPELLRTIEDEIRKVSDRAVSLSLSQETLNEGGVVLMSPDGRVRFDNSLSARMRRVQDAMRLLAVKTLVEE
ncbi:hypothetical protein JW906_10485 [bacterium]|nr:hypothetical protein [bacterium]